MRLVILVAFVLLSPLCHAVKIQIIHTNDLHSFFMGTRNGKGGYARLKTVIENLRQSARGQGMKTLHLDGGDFGEGSSFFMSNNGIDSLRALDYLGVDVSVIGNHDYLLGADIFANQIMAADLRAKIISANMSFKDGASLTTLVRGNTDFEIDGKKIRVIGLTTSEIHSQYPLKSIGKILNPIKIAKREEKKAAREGVDFTIALTHIGFEKDMKLVRKTKEIDLVVGGHSHTVLDKIHFERNKKGREIPIVQAGAHGIFVGELIIDLHDSGDAEILSYALHSVDAEIQEEPLMKEFVQNAFLNRENYFGRSWDEPIGFSEIPLSGYVDGQENKDSSCWGTHLSKIVQTATDADLGLHFSRFEGEAIKSGVIKFGDIVDNFPHFRNYGDSGWKIATSRMNGAIVRKLIRFIKKKSGQLGISYFFKAGIKKGFLGTRSYTIAYPSEIVYGLERTFPILKSILLPEATVTEKSYWPLIETYVRDNSPLRCLENES